MRYRARYLSLDGGAIEETVVEAVSPEQARHAVATRLGAVMSIKAEGPSRSKAARFDVAWWCRELRTLLRSGMTVVEAIETLAAARSDAAAGALNAALLAELQEGRSLSQAMRRLGAYPPVLVAQVTASERTSTLAEALDDYLRYHDLLDRLRRQALSAAIYPTLVMGLGAVIVVFLLLFVMPRFSRLYGETYGQVSWATELALALSRALQVHGWLIAAAAMATVAGSAALVKRRIGLLDRLVERFAPFRKRRDEFRLAKLYQSLALLMRGGYTIDEALEVAADLELGRRFEQAIAQVRHEVAQGRSASLSFSSAGLTDAVTLRLLAAGERSGAFDAVLQTVSERHATAFATFVERATRIAEPVLLLVVALVVGGIVVMMYMPIFDMAGNLGGGR